MEALTACTNAPDGLYEGADGVPERDSGRTGVDLQPYRARCGTHGTAVGVLGLLIAEAERGVWHRRPTEDYRRTKAGDSVTGRRFPIIDHRSVGW